LYSNYTIGHQNSERILCLILPSRLVESVSSASILHCVCVFLASGYDWVTVSLSFIVNLSPRVRLKERVVALW
jgi:hypothetical protein